jgi:hypothetical protein
MRTLAIQEFPKSPKSLMTPPDADDAVLTASRAAGCKMIRYHGVSGPLPMPVNTR